MKKHIKKAKKKMRKIIKGKNFMKLIIAMCTLAIIATSVLPYIL